MLLTVIVEKINKMGPIKPGKKKASAIPTVDANDYKEQGNRFFSMRKYNEALSCYSKAIVSQFISSILSNYIIAHYTWRLIKNLKLWIWTLLFIIIIITIIRYSLLYIWTLLRGVWTPKRFSVFTWIYQDPSMQSWISRGEKLMLINSPSLSSSDYQASSSKHSLSLLMKKRKLDVDKLSVLIG